MYSLMTRGLSGRGPGSNPINKFCISGARLAKCDGTRHCGSLRTDLSSAVGDPCWEGRLVSVVLEPVFETVIMSIDNTGISELVSSINPSLGPGVLSGVGCSFWTSGGLETCTSTSLDDVMLKARLRLHCMSPPRHRLLEVDCRLHR